MFKSPQILRVIPCMQGGNRDPLVNPCLESMTLKWWRREWIPYSKSFAAAYLRSPNHSFSHKAWYLVKWLTVTALGYPVAKQTLLGKYKQDVAIFIYHKDSVDEFMSARKRRKDAMFDFRFGASGNITRFQHAQTAAKEGLDIKD